MGRNLECPIVKADLDRFAPAAGAGPHTTTDNNWNAYDIPTPTFYTIVRGKETDLWLGHMPD